MNNQRTASTWVCPVCQRTHPTGAPCRGELSSNLRAVAQRILDTARSTSASANHCVVHRQLLGELREALRLPDEADEQRPAAWYRPVALRRPEEPTEYDVDLAWGDAHPNTDQPEWRPLYAEPYVHRETSAKGLRALLTRARNFISGNFIDDAPFDDARPLLAEIDAVLRGSDETTPDRTGWPATVALPVNRGYVVTPENLTKCIHGVQLARGDAYKACEPCFKLCTRPAAETDAQRVDRLARTGCTCPEFESKHRLGCRAAGDPK